MLLVRQTLTEVLLEATNEEIRAVAIETKSKIQKKSETPLIHHLIMFVCWSSAPSELKSKPKIVPILVGKSLLTQKLGLAAYGDSDSDDDGGDSDNGKSTPSKKTDNDSSTDEDSEDELRVINDLKISNRIPSQRDSYSRKLFVGVSIPSRKSRVRSRTDWLRRRNAPRSGSYSRSARVASLWVTVLIIIIVIPTVTIRRPTRGPRKGCRRQKSLERRALSPQLALTMGAAAGRVKLNWVTEII